MCRLLFDSTPHLRGEDFLEMQFNLLEESYGGDGNGISFLNTGKIVKGVKMANRNLSELAHLEKEPIFFHTRRASIGATVDSLCQPFGVGDITVAHNGHWSYWEGGLEILLRWGKMKHVPMDLSDSLVAAIMAKHYGPGSLKNYVATGVWLFASRTPSLKVLAIANTGDFVINFSMKQGASEPVLWDKEDDVSWLLPRSVFELFPKFELVSGGLQKNKPKDKKEAK